MKMNDKVYDILKWIAMYFLPALGTLYFALAQIWGLPFGEEIVGTITALDTFLGVIIGISNHTYEGDGVINVSKNSSKDKYHLEISTPTDELVNKKTVSLKVNAYDGK